jgi:hypothetical protein
MGAAALSLPIAGCGQLKPQSGDGVGKTQLQLTVDIKGNTDVAGMRFTLQQVDCTTGAPTATPPQVIDKDLEDLTIPDQVPAVANMPLDPNSSHVFADAFLTVAPGCYDVTTDPLDKNHNVSSDCAEAHLSKVLVNPEQTTEVFLINQCKGDPLGAIDVASALNHPPVLQSVMFEGSKFVPRCTPEVVCATAKDPDNDPLEWDWAIVDGGPAAGPKVISTTPNPDGSVTQCVQFEGLTAGKLDVSVTVYDLVSPNGTPERVEQWLADQGYPNPSHAMLTFPIYIADAGPLVCAPQCQGQTCSTFTECNAGGSCGNTGVCGSTEEGGGACVDGSTPCAGLADCSTSGDCGTGVCVINSCCGRNVCVPVDRNCTSPGAPAPAQYQTPALPMTPSTGPTLGKM